MPFDIAPKAGDWEVIAEVEVEADCDYVEFTGLDINSDRAYVIFMTVKNPQSSDAVISMYINGDTTDTNYYHEHITASGTSVNANRPNDAGITKIYAGVTNMVAVLIMRDTNGYVHASILATRGAPSSIELFVSSWVKATTETNVNTIRLQSSIAGGIGAGSKFILARVKRP